MMAESVEFLRKTISNAFKWDYTITCITRKAQQRLFFLP